VIGSAWRSLRRFLALLLIGALALQLYFLLRVALMAVVDPRSTTFERSEIWRLLVTHGKVLWAQQWVDGERISSNLKRAVIASEDAGFADHSGVDWDAIERAWERNAAVEERAERQLAANEKARRAAPGKGLAKIQAKLVGGSTITQQLAKNLFLDGERNLARKAQELVITGMLEALLSKQRILDIYLNHVEWGEGLFGAQAAARYYFRVDAAQLGVMPAARLAVMLPAPKRFEKRPASPYLIARATTVAARMGAVELP
jgi:monofunctional glycosyltransferase